MPGGREGLYLVTCRDLEAQEKECGEILAAFQKRGKRALAISISSIVVSGRANSKNGVTRKKNKRIRLNLCGRKKVMRFRLRAC